MRKGSVHPKECNYGSETNPPEFSCAPRAGACSGPLHVSEEIRFQYDLK